MAAASDVAGASSVAVVAGASNVAVVAGASSVAGASTVARVVGASSVAGVAGASGGLQEEGDMEGEESTVERRVEEISEEPLDLDELPTRAGATKLLRVEEGVAEGCAGGEATGLRSGAGREGTVGGGDERTQQVDLPRSTRDRTTNETPMDTTTGTEHEQPFIPKIRYKRVVK